MRVNRLSTLLRCDAVTWSGDRLIFTFRETPTLEISFESQDDAQTVQTVIAAYGSALARAERSKCFDASEENATWIAHNIASRPEVRAYHVGAMIRIVRTALKFMSEDG